MHYHRVGNRVSCYATIYHFVSFIIGRPSVLVIKHLMEVCPLARGLMLSRWFEIQCLSFPLQRGFRFFHLPLPASHRSFLRSPYLKEENVGLTPFHTCSRMGLGSVSTPGEQYPRLG